MPPRPRDWSNPLAGCVHDAGTAYVLSKRMVNHFTRVFAMKGATQNIRANAIAPGFFLTKQNHFLLTDEKTGELTDRGKTIIDHTPMARFG